MSYEIIYDKQFIKVEEDGVEKFCPFILAGSNNCYDMNNRRSRSWWSFTWITDGKGFVTMKEMIAKAEKEREDKIAQTKKRNAEYIANGQSMYVDEYSDSSWGSIIGMYINGSRSTSFGQYRGIFKTGCQKAVTVEQLAQIGYGSISITSGYSVKEKLEKFGKEEFRYSIRTSEELVEKYREAEKYLEGTGLTPQIDLSASERIGRSIRRKLFTAPTKEKERVEVDHYFVVKDFLEDNYIIKSTRGGYRFSRYGKRYAKQFRKESEAQRYATKLSLKYFKKERFVVEPVEETTVFHV